MKYEEKYKNSISDYLGVKSYQIDLYWKGRVALYALLKSFGIKDGDEIIIPAFTCVVVPNAIIYLNAKPIYVDVNEENLNTSLEQVKVKISDKTKCIIIQNTFGLSSEVEEIVTYARGKEILTIEDCTHGFGGTYNDQPNGTYCDAAFYSTQWNKPFSTGVGGFSLLNNLEYRESLNKINEQLKTPSKKDRYMLASLIQAKKYLLHDSTYWTALRIYRNLSKSGLVVGSSRGEELQSAKMPKDYFLGSTRIQNKVGISELNRLNRILNRRKSNGLVLNEFLKNKGKWHYNKDDLNNHSFLKSPIFVKDKDAFRKKAEKAKVRLGDWFVSSIHPVLQEFELWFIKPEDYPIANKLSQSILNLPTEDESLKKLINFLENNIDDLRNLE
ncbi:MAG: DegT/DnrJ/EryC1/StrS family aminotransferase [Brumimicrobium sp.]